MICVFDAVSQSPGANTHYTEGQQQYQAARNQSAAVGFPVTVQSLLRKNTAINLSAKVV